MDIFEQERKMIIGIDPGQNESGIAIVDKDYKIIDSKKISNEKLVDMLYSELPNGMIESIAMESIQSYGMTVGRTILETCYMIGRIIQICKHFNVDCKLYPRCEYGKYICGPKVKDPLIRSALEMRFGSYDKGRTEKRLKSGVIKQEFVPAGPLHLLQGSSDQRSAFAVCVYHLDLLKPCPNNGG